MRLHLITTMLLAAPWAGVAAAQDTIPSNIPKQSPDSLQRQEAAAMPLNDNDVLARMHATNQKEIKLGRIAQRNGGSARVRSFGARLVRDHSAADQKVVALAKKLGVQLTADQAMENMERRQSDTTQGQHRMTDTAQGYHRQQADTAHGQQMRDQKNPEHELKTLRGAAFDTAFARAMVEGHQKTVELLETAQGQVSNGELRSLIASTLPTVRQHLRIAQSLPGAAETTSSR